MKGSIYLLGLPAIDTPVKVETFENKSQSEVLYRLKELQKGYWQQGDGKVKIVQKEIVPGSILITSEIDNCDWRYGLRVKKDVWNENNSH